MFPLFPLPEVFINLTPWIKELHGWIGWAILLECGPIGLVLTLQGIFKAHGKDTAPMDIYDGLIFLAVGLSAPILGIYAVIILIPGIWAYCAHEQLEHFLGFFREAGNKA